MPVRHKKQYEEDEVKNGEGFPDYGNVGGEPVLKDDAAVGKFEKDSVDNQLFVGDGCAGDGDKHQREDDEQRGWELDISEMIGFGDFEPLKDRERRKHKKQAEQAVIKRGDYEQY